MNVKDTSLKAFIEITNNGEKLNLKTKVWKFIIDHGPCTQREVYTEFTKPGYTTGSITARFSDLKREGVIIEVGQVLNPKTGKSNESWDVTGNCPVKFEKPKKIKCTQCDGKGHFVEQQSRLF